MKKAAEYRRHAEECRKLAAGTLSTDDRIHLLDMAESWINLAATREKMLARYPELDMSRMQSADGSVKAGQVSREA